MHAILCCAIVIADAICMVGVVLCRCHLVKQQLYTSFVGRVLQRLVFMKGLFSLMDAYA